MPCGGTDSARRWRSVIVVAMEREPRWGITIPLHGQPMAAQREIISELAGTGYTDAWSAELNGADAFTPLVLASQACGSAPRSCRCSPAGRRCSR